MDTINERHALEAALDQDPKEMLRHLEVLPPDRLERLATASRELHRVAFRIAYEKRGSGVRGDDLKLSDVEDRY